MALLTNLFDRAVTGAVVTGNNSDKYIAGAVPADRGAGDGLLGYLQRVFDPTKVAMNYNTAERIAQQEYNSKEAQINRDWQKMMSDTSYQRAMSDLREAGLNPALVMQNGGASTPTGYSAQASNAYIANAGATSQVFKGILSLLVNTAVGIHKLSDSQALASMQADNAFKMLDMKIDAMKWKEESRRKNLFDQHYDRLDKIHGYPQHRYTKEFLDSLIDDIDDLDL